MRNLDLTHRTLCRLLSDPADVALTSAPGPEDWRLLAATARREGVAPLLYYALKETEWPANVPPDVQADLRQAYYATTARNLLVYRELSRILAALAAGPPMVRLSSPQAADRNTQLTSHITHPTSHIPPHAIPNPKSEIRNPKSGIPVVVLKGAALAATLYPSIGLRPMGDLDLLVPKEHLAEAVARLKALGYVEPYPEMAAGLNALVGWNICFQGGQDIHLAVELHWTLVGGEHYWYSPSLSWFWTQTEPFALSQGVEEQRGRGAERQNSKGDEERSPLHLRTSACPERSRRAPVLTFTPTAQLLYLCTHLMLQHGEARSALRWFYDIYLLVEREGQRIQWDQLVARAEEFRWAPAVYAALEGVRVRFCDSSDEEGDTWLLPGVLEGLARACDLQARWLVARRADSLQTRATSVVAAVSALSPRAFLRLLLASAIPSPAYMRWRYRPRPAWLWPLCYPYRWLDILREGLTTLWRMVSRRWRVAND